MDVCGQEQDFLKTTVLVQPWSWEGVREGSGVRGCTCGGGGWGGCGCVCACSCLRCGVWPRERGGGLSLPAPRPALMVSLPSLPRPGSGRGQVCAAPPGKAHGAGESRAAPSGAYILVGGGEMDHRHAYEFRPVLRS